MIVVAPMEQMECSHIARQDDFIVIRCGEGQAMLVLQYVEGEEELKEIDFIDLSSQPEKENESSFVMNGGHSHASGTGCILVADSCGERLGLRALKNRSQ